VQADGSSTSTHRAGGPQRQMDWSLPDEEATTIAGLVIHEAQTIPEPGRPSPSTATVRNSAQEPQQDHRDSRQAHRSCRQARRQSLDSDAMEAG